MTWFTQSAYKIKITDKAYIDALIRIQPDLPIESLTNSIGAPIEFTGNLSLKDLPSFFEKFSAEIEKTDGEIIVTTPRVTGPSTIGNALPRFESNPAYVLETEKEKLGAAVRGIRDYISRRENCGHDILMRSSLGKLTQEEAWKALTLACERSPIRSAIGLPSKQVIWGQLNDWQQFFLYYGDKSVCCDGPQWAFDCDDGFCDTPFQFHPIPQELKDAFEQWKSNDRKGPVLKSNYPGAYPVLVSEPSSHWSPYFDQKREEQMEIDAPTTTLDATDQRLLTLAQTLSEENHRLREEVERLKSELSNRNQLKS